MASVVFCRKPKASVGLLKRSDIILQRIYIHRVKSGLSGEQIMSVDVVNELELYLKQREDSSNILFLSRNSNSISTRTLDYLVKKYCREANISIDKSHFHSLRHSIAVHLIESGADILSVRDILGHKNIQNTMVYHQMVFGPSGVLSFNDKRIETYSHKKVVYFIQSVNDKAIKIGFTSNLKNRFTDLQIGSPSLLKLLVCVVGDRRLEKELHRKFADSKIHGEWYFPTSELLSYIIDLILHETSRTRLTIDEL